jgi:hypothetical protein
MSNFQTIISDLRKEMIVDYAKIEYTREWFDNKDNQAHTIQDRMIFHPDKPYENEIVVDDYFLIDLYYNDELDDSEIWEVRSTKEKIYDKIRRQWFNFKPIRKITTGKQFGYPNGYWKVNNKVAQAKLDQTLLCEKIANELLSQQNKTIRDEANLEHSNREKNTGFADTLIQEKQKHKDFVELLEKKLCLYVVPCFKRLRINPCYNCQKIFNVLAELESEVTK